MIPILNLSLSFSCTVVVGTRMICLSMFRSNKGPQFSTHESAIRSQFEYGPEEVYSFSRSSRTLVYLLVDDDLNAPTRGILE